MSIDNLELGYCFCNNKWFLDEKIKNELSLLLLISSLSSINGFCTLKDEYLAQILKIDENTLLKKIKKLQKIGYIKIGCLKDDNNHKVRCILISTSEEIKNIEIERKTITVSKKKAFKKPTLKEIETFCSERKNNVNAKKFYDYYNLSDWTDSKGKRILNWKQKLIAVWERNSIVSSSTDCTKVLPKHLQGKTLLEMSEKERKEYYDFTDN